MGFIDSLKEALGGDRDEQADAAAPSDGTTAESTADYAADFSTGYQAGYQTDHPAGPAADDSPAPRHAALDAPDENPDDEWLVTGGKHAARD
jgi:hypothetical protein